MVLQTAFNSGWTVRPKVSGFTDLVAGVTGGESVVLPHDAMIGLERSSVNGEGPSTAYFPGGVVEYTKTFDVPHEWRRRRISIEFDGVYRDAMVFVNGVWAGQRPHGYMPFMVTIDSLLRFGESNTVRVEARAHQDSRWYSGLGIHRGVNLLVAPLVHIPFNGVRVTTRDIDGDGALIEVSTTVRNDDLTTDTLQLRTRIDDPSGQQCLAAAVPVTVGARTETVVQQRFYLAGAKLWSVDHPHLYSVASTVAGVEESDHHVVQMGIRRLQLDPQHGLRINGDVVKLRGACIHHDNGPLGAAAIGRAEERRIEILKTAGFNAIRSSHNPVSAEMLDACDRLGMLVVDEGFDMWFEGMKPHDYSLSFAEWWARDLAAMVARDFNHPSVIMYSIGNEVPEAGSGLGAATSRDMVHLIRSLDDTRFTTNAVSSFWAVSREILGDFVEEVSALESRGVNDIMNAMSDIFGRITTSDLVTHRTAETHAAVDVAGLNYAETRYVSDGQLFPHRVMVGTETNPRETDRIWDLVSELSYVIGDFTWTGWDYLGEVGLGRTDYPEDSESSGGGDPPFPWLLAWCGDIDITGHRRPASYYREIVWGRRQDPYIAVFRPEHYGRRRAEMSWAWTDTVASWTWAAESGSPVEVEVYSDADEVELILNGSVVGRAAVGRSHRLRAVFEARYHPGSLVAVAYTNGVETGRHSLVTAVQPALTVTADRTVLTANAQDLAFVAIEMVDPSGVVDTTSSQQVLVTVTGAGKLQALGTGRPATTEKFGASQCTLFDGRALAVIRPTGPGTILVTVSDGVSIPAEVALTVQGKE
jgi:beta-galactosidase